MAGTAFDPLTYSQSLELKAALATAQTDIAAIKARVNAMSAGIKSVQRGVTTTTSITPISVTISPVNTGKATTSLLSLRVGDIGGNAQVRLTSSTTIEVTGTVNTSGSNVAWEVVEWY